MFASFGRLTDVDGAGLSWLSAAIDSHVIVQGLRGLSCWLAAAIDSHVIVQGLGRLAVAIDIEVIVQCLGRLTFFRHVSPRGCPCICLVAVVGERVESSLLPAAVDIEIIVRGG